MRHGQPLMVKVHPGATGHPGHLWPSCGSGNILGASFSDTINAAACLIGPSDRERTRHPVRYTLFQTGGSAFLGL